jgi:hypothetical protein
MSSTERRRKRFLSAEQKYDLWVRMLTGQLTTVQAAAEAGVDRTTIATLKRVARDGAIAALEASKPAVVSTRRARTPSWPVCAARSTGRRRRSSSRPSSSPRCGLLKRWLAGTLHDGHSQEHLEYYLDEFTFRFNRRTSRRRGLLFYRLLQQAVRTDPHPLRELVVGDRANHII